MAIQVIYLDEADDIVSIKDQLKWVRESQVALVLPPKADLLADYLDLALLRRYCDENRLELGLVTTDHRVTSQAKALGIPTFPSVRATTQGRRRWWRGRQRREQVGQPTRLEIDDRQEVVRRREPRPEWQRWMRRYVAILFYILTMTVLFIAAVYAFPRATIVLSPETQPVSVRRQIVADPLLQSVEDSGSSVPGRVLVSVQEWQAEVETTGGIEIADSPAQGTVIIVNQIDQAVTVPAGTRVSTSGRSRVEFQLTEDVEIAGITGATAEAPVIAIEPGASGNVAAGRINRLGGPLSSQLDVRNLNATTGGGVRVEPSVTEDDQQRLRSQVMQQLQVRALADMQSKLTSSEFLARESLRVVDVTQETFSHFPGEESERLTLEIRAELQATAVDQTAAIGMVYQELANSVGQDFELVPESLNFINGDIIGVDNEGRVTYEVGGEGIMAARLPEDDMKELIAGQDAGLASSFLFEQLPLSDYPVINIWPEWYNRLPYLPIRIQTINEPGI